MVFTLLLTPLLFVDMLVLISVFTNRFDSIALSLVLLALLVIVGAPLLLMIGYQWKQDMLSYTYKPIRLVRSTRKVHVFRHNGPGGVWSLDWDKLVFCLKKGD
ncbi:hypothetical protein WI61_34040 [Burkholderia cepacia]|nr:hypothetical protein [Burkholderia cepacia]KVA65113.1 hypothetical protein WI48_38115 [Burkholderia cepacia]KVA66329.1 hypothetical protein WI49_12600 [Burkholderia cepacia]KVA85154.1 hypothetical protein WI52_15320 [Burkholderia cepacia]KVA86354.1 hypothetical protein WI50_15490 [Burkholderia cepacia]KVA89869.1 hypothetical protein WI51_12790 [Burkholderia cepacia]